MSGSPELSGNGMDPMSDSETPTPSATPPLALAIIRSLVGNVSDDEFAEIVQVVNAECIRRVRSKRSTHRPSDDVMDAFMSTPPPPEDHGPITGGFLGDAQQPSDHQPAASVNHQVLHIDPSADGKRQVLARGDAVYLKADPTRRLGRVFSVTLDQDRSATPRYNVAFPDPSEQDGWARVNKRRDEVVYAGIDYPPILDNSNGRLSAVNPVIDPSRQVRVFVAAAPPALDPPAEPAPAKFVPEGTVTGTLRPARDVPQA